MSRARRRLFVPASALAGGRLDLAPEDARRALWLGVRAGDEILALDDSGWSWSVLVDRCDATGCSGQLTGRWLASERRTKITLYVGVLHPYDYRRLLVAGTDVGIVAFVPVIADHSPIAALGGSDHDEAAWPRLVRDAAEAGGRGRLPLLSAPMMLDHALDDVARQAIALAVAAGGLPLEEALVGRPFSIGVFCPPAAGFSAAEADRLQRQGVTPVRAPSAPPDPVLAALTLVRRIYHLLEPEEPDAQAGSDGPSEL